MHGFILPQIYPKSMKCFGESRPEEVSIHMLIINVTFKKTAWKAVKL